MEVKMKSTGIVRRLDKLGRIVIPKELRSKLMFDEREPLEIYLDEDRIALKSFKPLFYLCGSCEELIEFKGKSICCDCREHARQL